FAWLVLLVAPCLAQQNVPQIPFDSVPDFLKLPPGMNFGEVPGVAVDSKGHIFVFTRSNSANGPAYGAAAAQLLEFGSKGEFLREIGKGLYAWSEAHSVRIDKDDNIWAIDKGSDMIIQFNQAGRGVWVFGRRKEAADEGAKPWEHVNPPLPPIDGRFRQHTDVTWDSEGNIYTTARSESPGRQRPYANRRAPGRGHWAAEFHLHYAWTQSGPFCWRKHVSRADLQGCARRQSAWGDWTFRTQS